MNEKITISEDGYLMLQGSWTDEEAATYFGKTSEKIKNLHIVIYVGEMKQMDTLAEDKPITNGLAHSLVKI